MCAGPMVNRAVHGPARQPEPLWKALEAQHNRATHLCSTYTLNASHRNHTRSTIAMNEAAATAVAVVNDSILALLRRTVVGVSLPPTPPAAAAMSCYTYS